MLQVIIKHYNHSHFQFQPLKWSDNYLAKCVFSLCDCLTLQDNHFERYKKKQEKITVINNMLKRSRTDFKHLNGKHLDVGKKRVLYCAKVSRYLNL